MYRQLRIQTSLRSLFGYKNCCCWFQFHNNNKYNYTTSRIVHTKKTQQSSFSTPNHHHHHHHQYNHRLSFSSYLCVDVDGGGVVVCVVSPAIVRNKQMKKKNTIVLQTNTIASFSSSSSTSTPPPPPQQSVEASGAASTTATTATAAMEDNDKEMIANRNHNESVLEQKKTFKDGRGEGSTTYQSNMNKATKKKIQRGPGGSSSSNKSKKKMRVFTDNDNDSTNNNKHNNNNEDNTSCSNRNTEAPHSGSYASSAMRELFHVTLSHPETSMTSSVCTPTTNNNNDNDNDNRTADAISTTNATAQKRKVAMLLGYVGTNYCGFQMNAMQRTIQAELELAMYRVGLITESNFGYPSKYGWSTSGRTDKGVHAAAQVVSAKMELPIEIDTTTTTTALTATATAPTPTPKPTTKATNATYKAPPPPSNTPSTVLEHVREQLNNVLPSDFQVLDIVRATRTFCAKTQRDRVRYQYMIPSFVLQNSNSIRTVYDPIISSSSSSSKKQQQQGSQFNTDPIKSSVVSSAAQEGMDNNDGAKNHDDIMNDQGEVDHKEKEHDYDYDEDDEEEEEYNYDGTKSGFTFTMDEIKAIQEQFHSYRVTKQQLSTLQQALHQYEGTHSFHNFSRKVQASEARAIRYIVSFRVGEPIIYNDVEWIPTSVVGQSFLLNQIRKMICLAIDVTRFNTNDGTGTGTSSVSTSSSTNTNTTTNSSIGIDIVSRALKKESNIRLSQAPAQGLFLEMSYYDSYNRKIRRTNPELKSLDWSTIGTKSNNRWYEFRNTIIMKHIATEEVEQGNFIQYLYNQEYLFDYASYYGIKDGQMKR